MATVSRKEKKKIEEWVRSLYEDIVDIKIEVNPEDTSKFIVKVTRGVLLPPMEFPREE